MKHLIEGYGIPHTEMDLISVDNHFVDFSYTIRGGEQVSVYPFFKSRQIDQSKRLQEPNMPNPKFVADVNIGKLAR